ncbi:MAG TPA: hypothetical protein VJ418_31430 [Streptosporangiaceae bacterium]|jgi:hypothetical protein|nr:hypothetical protein [Streptosporangiaceae bacterium]
MSLVRVSLRLPHWRQARLERDSLVGYLSSIDYEPDADERQLFEQAGLGRVLPLLLGLDQDLEFALCRDVARHRLGADPDPGALPF